MTASLASPSLVPIKLWKNLPPKVQSDVKSLLELKKSEASTQIYKEIKDEILRIYAPKTEDKYKLALSRVLTGLPSQLGLQLVNDICDKSTKLSCGCCIKAVFTLWCLQLPASVKGHIANMPFTQDTYRTVFNAADKVFLSTKPADIAPSVAAIVKVEEETPNNSTEVASVRTNPANRGRRGGRGGGSGRGGNRNGGNNGSRSGNPSGAESTKQRKRHSSNPPSSCCDNHYRWADSAWFCLAPLTCPYVNKCAERPKGNKN